MSETEISVDPQFEDSAQPRTPGTLRRLLSWMAKTVLSLIFGTSCLALSIALLLLLLTSIDWIDVEKHLNALGGENSSRSLVRTELAEVLREKVALKQRIKLDVKTSSIRDHELLRESYLELLELSAKKQFSITELYRTTAPGDGLLSNESLQNVSLLWGTHMRRLVSADYEDLAPLRADFSLSRKTLERRISLLKESFEANQTEEAALDTLLPLLQGRKALRSKLGYDEKSGEDTELRLRMIDLIRTACACELALVEVAREQPELVSNEDLLLFGAWLGACIEDWISGGCAVEETENFINSLATVRDYLDR